VISYELVHKNDFGIDGGGQGVGLREQLVFGVVFDGSYCGSPLVWGNALVMRNFLQTKQPSQAGCAMKM
jgi:hypothetical protein